MKVARNPCEYFADRLQRAMKGVGTDESDLTRVIVSRSEVSIVVTFLVFVPHPATSKLIICAPPPPTLLPTRRLAVTSSQRPWIAVFVLVENPPTFFNMTVTEKCP